jgi:hypothetical protein
MPMPTPEEFYVTTPLYEGISFVESNNLEIHNIVTSELRIDFFCLECGKESVHTSGAGTAGGTLPLSHYHVRSGWVVKEFVCARAAHKSVFLSIVDKCVLTKVGQFPSIADLHIVATAQYRSILPAQRLNELNKGIGLAAHGVGIGSFVYLRRIIEHLVDEAHNFASKESGWDDATYQKSRFQDRIKLLSAHLPDFLVTNKLVYGLLSKGIHELEENECLAAFPIMKACIEITLDEILSEHKKLEKTKNAVRELQRISAQTKDAVIA